MNLAAKVAGNLSLAYGRGLITGREITNAKMLLQEAYEALANIYPGKQGDSAARTPGRGIVNAFEKSRKRVQSDKDSVARVARGKGIANRGASDSGKTRGTRRERGKAKKEKEMT